MLFCAGNSCKKNKHTYETWKEGPFEDYQTFLRQQCDPYYDNDLQAEREILAQAAARINEGPSKGSPERKKHKAKGEKGAVGNAQDPGQPENDTANGQPTGSKLRRKGKNKNNNSKVAEAATKKNVTAPDQTNNND